MASDCFEILKGYLTVCIYTYLSYQGILSQVLVINFDGSCSWMLLVLAERPLVLEVNALSSSPSDATNSARSNDTSQETYFLIWKDGAVLLFTYMAIVSITILSKLGKLCGKYEVLYKYKIIFLKVLPF